MQCLSNHYSTGNGYQKMHIGAAHLSHVATSVGTLCLKPFVRSVGYLMNRPKMDYLRFSVAHWS